MDLLARLLYLHPQTPSRRVRLSTEAERDGAYRVAKRLQAVVLNSEGRTSGELAGILKAPRSRVSEWLSLYQTHGVEGRLEGSRSGRPPLLTAEQRTPLGELLDRGPVVYGLDTGLWRSPMLAGGIEEECGVAYPPGHVRKLRHSMGFSVQRPPRVLARRYRRRGAILIQDNASYHKDADRWKWFAANRHWREVHQLPPYSPELNPTERLGQHPRKNGTPTRYFATEAELGGHPVEGFRRDAIPPRTDPLVSPPFLLSSLSC